MGKICLVLVIFSIWGLCRLYYYNKKNGLFNETQNAIPFTLLAIFCVVLPLSVCQLASEYYDNVIAPTVTETMYINRITYQEKILEKYVADNDSRLVNGNISIKNATKVLIKTQTKYEEWKKNIEIAKINPFVLFKPTIKLRGMD